MASKIVAVLKTLLSAAALACCLAGPARAQVDIELFPPAEYVATTAPVYYEGRAAYWYGNRWYYRDGGNWRHYDREPARLRGYRGGHAPVRQFYGRGRMGGGGRRR